MNYIVVWTAEDEEGQLHDSWSVHETLSDARRRYFSLLRGVGLYSASLCSVMLSTDYESSRPYPPPRRKLTANQVRAIRWLYELGATQRALGVRFGITEPNVSYIVRGHRWPKAGGPIKETS